jgi:hypothetical protein
MKNLFACIGFLYLAVPLCAQSAAKPAAVTCSFANPPKTDADRAFAAEHLSEAEGLYTQQLAASPSEAAWIGLVHVQIEMNKVTDALATANRATAAMPKSAAMRALVGDAELRAGHIEEASAAFTQARTMDTCLAASHFGLARIMELESLHASAQKELALAHRLVPTDAAISETLFATLPPAMHAKGLRNLLASDKDLSPDHRLHLEQLAALLEAGATCHSVEMSGPTKIELAPLLNNGVHLRDFGLHAVFGAGASLNLDLDSTASGIVLSETDAKKLNVTPVGPHGQTSSYVGTVPSVQIGSLHYEKCPVTVVPDAVLAGRYSVIGTDFFRDSLIHLDWNAKLLTLTPYPGPAVYAAEITPVDAATPAAEKDWSHAFIDRQRILVPALIDKKPVGIFMLDTSYLLNVMAPALAARFHPEPDATLAIFGVSGDLVRTFQKDGGADLNRTELVDFKGDNLPVRLVSHNVSARFAGNAPPDFGLWSYDINPTSHAAGIEVSAIIGFRVLRQYYFDIDYRNGLVSLKYDLDFPFRKNGYDTHY